MEEQVENNLLFLRGLRESLGEQLSRDQSGQLVLDRLQGEVIAAVLDVIIKESEELYGR